MTVAATLLDGRYSLDERIGAGGFSEVWRATDTVLMRPVAVKLLRACHVDQPETRERFKAEARNAGALSHENITRVYDYGEPGCGRATQSYLVMELIEGPSLAAMLAAGPLGAAQTMDIVAQVAAGLQAAHSAGLIHRDIKPTNIVFTSGGTARITDFGIAHLAGSAPLTATGLVLGTPDYLAPERIAGAGARPASDLYSLGIMAYECLAGVRPFSGPPLEVAIAHRDRPLPPLPGSLPSEVAAFVMMLTAKDPASRPASADKVACHARRLQGQLTPDATGARPHSAWVPLTTARAAETQVQGVRSRTRIGRMPRAPRAPRAPRLRGAVALVALTWLALLMVAWPAPASYPPARPSSAPRQAAASRQAAPSVTESPPRASAAPVRPVGRPPSAAPSTGIGTAAAVAEHFPPGQSRRKNGPAAGAKGHAPHQPGPHPPKRPKS